jgi:hypothetical protein
MTTPEAFLLARAALGDVAFTVQTWADAKARGNLHDVASFQAYVALDEVWPKNQTTDESATAHELNRAMQTKIERPAMALWLLQGGKVGGQVIAEPASI